jgi:arylsulfatase A-like enzyme/sugar lactone lactonase YvrE
MTPTAPARRLGFPVGRIARLACGAMLLSTVAIPALGADAPRWNILFVFADDWGRYAGCYGGLDGRPTINDVVKTPAVDRLAREGVVFRNAFVSAPSCTPCRSALLSGRHFFQCGRGAILQGAIWDGSIPTYPGLVEQAGYRLGKSYKVWSPGTPADAPFGGQAHAYEKAGRRPNDISEEATKLVAAGADPAAARAEVLGEVRDNFRAFLADGAADTPWHFFCGPTTTHRKWVKGSGRRLWGIDPESLTGKLPPFLPDVPEVREDVADYLGEVQAVDAIIGVLVAELEARGMLDRTLVVVSGDHGMPGVPRGKCNVYDHGSAVPLVARVPGGRGGRVVDDFVTLPDLCPTFLDIAGVPHPPGLSARSLLPQLTAAGGGQIDPARDAVIIGRERHVAAARDDHSPYPVRALRTRDWLLVRNFHPERPPMGMPPQGAVDPAEVAAETYTVYADMDGSPTKAWLVAHAADPAWRTVHDLAFAKRPATELYDLRADPWQVTNLAGRPEHAATEAALTKRLLDTLAAAGDPRVDEEPIFERSPFTDPNPAAAQKQARRQPRAAKPDAAERLFEAEPLTAEGAFTPGIEGPACDRTGALFAVNLAREGTIGQVSPTGSAAVFLSLPGTSVGNGIRFGADGTMFIADYVNHNVFAVAPGTREPRLLAHDDRMNQPNDLAIAADGTLYASDPDWKAGTGQLWRIDRDGQTTRLAAGMGTTNGIDVSPDGTTLYVNESVQRNVWAFPILPDRTLGEKRLVKRFPDHGFDGMRCDIEGNLHVTRYGKGTVAVLQPDGTVVREIDVLGSKPSNICFGGPDGRTVYVTEVEHTRVVRYRTDVPGLSSIRWADQAAPAEGSAR